MTTFHKVEGLFASDIKDGDYVIVTLEKRRNKKRVV